MKLWSSERLPGGEPGFTREDVAVLRAAASLAAAVEPRRRAAHLADRLQRLADRVEEVVPALDAAA